MPMIATYAPMFMLLIVAFSLASIFYGVATYLGRHKKPNAEKNAPFECGSESTGGHLKLSVKFYLTAILFVVFDIEAVFVYPWAIHFRSEERPVRMREREHRGAPEALGEILFDRHPLRRLRHRSGVRLSVGHSFPI